MGRLICQQCAMCDTLLSSPSQGGCFVDVAPLLSSRERPESAEPSPLVWVCGAAHAKAFRTSVLSELASRKPARAEPASGSTALRALLQRTVGSNRPQSDLLWSLLSRLASPNLLAGGTLQWEVSREGEEGEESGE